MNRHTAGALGFARAHGWTFVASVGVVAFAVSLCQRSINLTDEGYLLTQALDMLSGKVLYRDMDAFVSPGIWFLLAGLFSVTEPSVLASRGLALGGYLATVFLTYRIAARLTSQAWAWGAVGILMIFTVWAFPAWTITFYSPFAILFALAAIDRLLEWRASGRTGQLFLCGIAIGLSIAFKQNYGAFALAGALLATGAVFLERGEALRSLVRGLFAAGLWMGAGVVCVVVPVIGYFAYAGALAEMYELLVLHPFVFMGRQDIAYPALSRLWSDAPLSGVETLTYGAFSLFQAPSPFYSSQPILAWLEHALVLPRLHVLLFWLPVVGLATGLALALRPLSRRRPIDGGLAAVLAVSAFVFLGVFPRADFNHLINVFQPTLLAGVVVAHRLVERQRETRPGVLRVGLAFGTVLLVLYAGVAVSWYRHALDAFDTPVGTRRGGVLVSAIEKNLLDFHVRAIQERTRDGDAVLTVPALATLNFLADRRVPGRYYNLYEHHIAHDGGAGVVEASEANRVSLVVADYDNFFSDRVGLRVYAPKLASYLRTHFEPEFDVAIDRFQYLRRRDEPIPDREQIDILAGCDVAAGSSAYTRERLRFASLYHAHDVEKPEAIQTECTIRVPERAEFVVSLGQRHPGAASLGATLTAEIWRSDGGSAEPLLAATIPVKPVRGWKTEPAAEHRIDLSRFAGQEITLVLSSSFDGRARMNPLDLERFALVWQDPHLEVRRDRALLIGIDGATLRVIEPLMAEGRLPNLAEIARRGVSGKLRPNFPLLSPRIWTTIATGKGPDKHGITGFVQKIEGGGKRLQLATDRKVPAIWNITSAFGFSNGVVNWFSSYPPEKIRGVIVSDFAIPGVREAREKFFAGNPSAVGHVDESVTYPSDWAKNVDRIAREGKPLLAGENPFGGNDAFPPWMGQKILAQSFRDDDLVTRIALEVDAQVRPNLLMAYLSGIDRVSHHLWGALEPPEIYPRDMVFTDSQRRATREALEEYYVYTDQLIGKLVERFDPADLVMVVSDHGFEGGVVRRGLTGAHDSPAAQDGVIFAQGGRIHAGASTDGTYVEDVTPTILAWLGLPVGLDMDGHVAKLLDVRSFATVSSHDGIPIERATSQKMDVEDAIIDQFRGLGYVK